MNTIEQEKAALKKLIGKSRFKIMTETAAIISSLLEPHDLTPVVVGGLAVEIYTRGQYTTLDIDMVVPGRKLVADILEKLGFLKEGHQMEAAPGCARSAQTMSGVMIFWIEDASTTDHCG